MESDDSSRCEAFIELHLTCTILEVILGLDKDVKSLSEKNYNTLISFTKMDKINIDFQMTYYYQFHFKYYD